MSEFSGEISSAHIRTEQEEIIDLQNELHKYARLASDRLVMLRRENTRRFSRGQSCFFCDKYPLLNAKIDSDYKKVYIDFHADDCEWIKILDNEIKR